MTNAKYIVAGLIGSAVLTISAIGIANAATLTAKSNNFIGLSRIPKSIFLNEKLDATAQVLKTSVNTVKTDKKVKSLSQLITTDGLSRKTFARALRAQLKSDLEAKGYKFSQINLAFEHQLIVRLRHQIDSLEHKS